jgi:hypothetical protein
MVKSTVDRWTVKRLLDLVEQKKVVVPQFQRGLVWGQRRKDELFDSLLKGYPIGSILVARDPKHPDSYRLLDGLQRTSTLRVFLEPGLQWLNEAHFSNLDSESLLELLARIIHERQSKKAFDVVESALETL